VTQFLFFVAAIGALGGALGVVLLRNPFYSVLSLAFHLVCLAALFLLLHAEFVAAATGRRLRRRGDGPVTCSWSRTSAAPSRSRAARC